jgi:hypothetical protein
MSGEVEQMLLQLQMSGFCILRDVIPATECKTIRDSVALTVQHHRSNSPDAPANLGFLAGVINHDQSFAGYLADGRLLAIVEKLLGLHVRISFTSAMINEPGNQRGDWHADWPFNQRNAGRIPTPYPDTVMHVTTL